MYRARLSRVLLFGRLGSANVSTKKGVIVKMAIFESNLVQVSTVTSAAIIWDPSNTSTTTYGPLGAVPTVTPTQTLRDVTIVNNGPGVLFIGQGSAVTNTGTTAALPVPVGGQVTIQGYTAVAGTTAGRIYGVSASTSAVEVGLGSVVSVD